MYGQWENEKKKQIIFDKDLFAQLEWLDIHIK